MNRMERFLRWLDRHMIKLIMVICIIFLSVKLVDSNRQRHVYQMKMIEATEKYNEMHRDWSECYVSQADAIEKSTKCQNDLWDLRHWLQEKYNNKEI
jgi:hypothetical protein